MQIYPDSCGETSDRRQSAVDQLDCYKENEALTLSSNSSICCLSSPLTLSFSCFISLSICSFCSATL